MTINSPVIGAVHPGYTQQLLAGLNQFIVLSNHLQHLRYHSGSALGVFYGELKRQTDQKIAEFRQALAGRAA